MIGNEMTIELTCTRGLITSGNKKCIIDYFNSYKYLMGMLQRVAKHFQKLPMTMILISISMWTVILGRRVTTTTKLGYISPSSVNYSGFFLRGATFCYILHKQFITSSLFLSSLPFFLAN
jgi:hypothetical protein